MASSRKKWKVGMVEYCWGGRYAVRAARRESMVEDDGPAGDGGAGATAKKSVPLVDALVALHPSNLVLLEDANEIVVLVSVGWGEHESMVSLKAKNEFETAWGRDAKNGGASAEMENVLWSPGRHGFAVRGNPDDAEERKILEGTESQTVKWFEKYLV